MQSIITSYKHHNHKKKKKNTNFPLQFLSTNTVLENLVPTAALQFNFKVT